MLEVNMYFLYFILSYPLSIKQDIKIIFLSSTSLSNIILFSDLIFYFVSFVQTILIIFIVKQ
jgi:hypothetical protein